MKVDSCACFKATSLAFSARQHCSDNPMGQTKCHSNSRHAQARRVIIVWQSAYDELHINSTNQDAVFLCPHSRRFGCTVRFTLMSCTPLSLALSSMPSSSMASMVAFAAAQPRMLPPYVPPCTTLVFGNSMKQNAGTHNEINSRCLDDMGSANKQDWLSHRAADNVWDGLPVIRWADLGTSQAWQQCQQKGSHWQCPWQRA